MEEVEPILAMLESVLEPLGERRREIVDYARDYIGRSPVVTSCMDEQGNVFGLGQDDPIAPENEPRKVYGMFQDWQTRTVVVHSFSTLSLDGREAIQFHQATVYKPTHVVCVVGHDALFNELRGYLAGIDPEEPADRVNGAAH